MENLANKKCRACELGEGKLNHADISAFMVHTPKWTTKDDHEISREFKFKNFAEALAFVNKIGALAESEGHHPDISFGWGYATVTLFTHAVESLSENDFIMASKIDWLYKWEEKVEKAVLPKIFSIKVLLAVVTLLFLLLLWQKFFR